MHLYASVRVVTAACEIKALGTWGGCSEVELEPLLHKNGPLCESGLCLVPWSSPAGCSHPLSAGTGPFMTLLTLFVLSH